MNVTRKIDKKETAGGEQDGRGGLTIDGRVPLSLGASILAVLSDGKLLSLAQLKGSPMVARLLKDKKENSFYTALSRLVRRSIVCKTGSTYGLGVKGQYQVLRSYVLSHQRKEREARGREQGDGRSPKVWDGKWRVVVFDIPERQRSLRDFLRNTMKRLGAHELLRSFWVYPYRIPEYIEKTVDSEFYRGKAYIMTTSDIEYGPRLRKIFSLQ